MNMGIAHRAAAVSGAFVLFAPGASALAQETPRDITIVAPAAPGGGWDQIARAMQHVLRTPGIARSVQVVNAPGAAGTIGLARFVNSEAGNGNALLITGLVMMSGIASNRSPVTLADVTPLARLSGEYEVIVVPAASSFQSLRDLVAAFQSNPRAVSWGGGSAGGTDEILVKLLAAEVGVDPAAVNYIAYAGGGQVLASVLGAHVTSAVSGFGEFAAQIESGALRALAISAPARVPGSDVPTFIEQGIDVALLNWRGVVAPPGVSRAERRELESLMRRMASSAEWKAVLNRNGWTDMYMEGAQFERFLTDETARVAALVASSKPGERGSGGYPMFVLVGGAVVLIAAAGQIVRAHRRGTDVPREIDAASRPNNRTSLATLALALLASIALMNTGGFVVASTLMFALAARAFGSQRPVRDLILGVSLSVIIYVAFTRGLAVTLPAGPFG